MDHIGLSAGFRTCICPICGISVHQDQISRHVELHFETKTASGKPTQLHIDLNDHSAGNFRGKIDTITLADNFLSVCRIFLTNSCYGINFLEFLGLEMLHLGDLRAWSGTLMLKS